MTYETYCNCDECMAPWPDIKDRDSFPEWKGKCVACKRKTVSAKEIGKRCDMPQPNGHRCPGRILALEAFKDEEGT